MKFGGMAHGQNNDSFHRRQNVGEHSGFVYSEIIRLIQYSWKCGFWKRKTYAISWLYYNFSALDRCGCESNENGRFSTQLGLNKLG